MSNVPSTNWKMHSVRSTSFAECRVEGCIWASCIRPHAKSHDALGAHVLQTKVQLLVLGHLCSVCIPGEVSLYHLACEVLGGMVSVWLLGITLTVHRSSCRILMWSLQTIDAISAEYL